MAHQRHGALQIKRQRLLVTTNQVHRCFRCQFGLQGGHVIDPCRIASLLIVAQHQQLSADEGTCGQKDYRQILVAAGKAHGHDCADKQNERGSINPRHVRGD